MELEYRHEDKYLISLKQMIVLQNQLDAFCSLDSHTVNGRYNIRSLYYDDYYDDSYYSTECGVDNRSKYRIRVYNKDYSKLFLERKSKHHGLISKQKELLPSDYDISIMNVMLTENYNTDNILQNNLYLLHHNNLLHPTVVIQYDRIPYVYMHDDSNVRITFDINICASCNCTRFLYNDIGWVPLTNGTDAILEVKYSNRLPDIIRNYIGLEYLNRISFSKYYLCRNLIRR